MCAFDRVRWQTASTKLICSSVLERRIPVHHSGTTIDRVREANFQINVGVRRSIELSELAYIQNLCLETSCA